MSIKNCINGTRNKKIIKAFDDNIKNGLSEDKAVANVIKEQALRISKSLATLTNEKEQSILTENFNALDTEKETIYFDSNIDNPFTSINDKNGDLKSEYQKAPETVQPSKAQVFVPSRFRDISGNLIDLFEGEGDNRKYIEKIDGKWMLKNGVADDLLEITSFRIPTSAHVSGSAVEIAGFLPPESGDLMIVPSEFAVQKGLDYDVDKEFSYHLNHLTDDNGNIVSIEQAMQGVDIDQQLNTSYLELQKLKQDLNDNIVYNNILEQYKESGSESLTLKQVLNDWTVTADQYTNADSNEKIKIQLQRIKFLKNFKKLKLQNEIVRINHAILGSNDDIIKKKVNSALSMADANKQADILQDKDSDFETILSDGYQRKKMNLGATGQMGIGVYANYTVLNSLLQQVDSPVFINSKFHSEQGKYQNTNINIGGYVFNGKLGRLINILHKDDINIIANNNWELKKRLLNGTISKDEIKTILNGKHPEILNRIRHIAEVFNERLNTATDNEKEQIMGRTGVNANTINVDSLMSLMGFDKSKGKKTMSMAYLLISQPIVKEYIKQKQKSKIHDDYRTFKEIIEDIKFNYDQHGAASEREYFSEGPVSNDSLTSDVLLGQIKNGYSAAIQLAIFDIYLEIESMTNDVTDIQQLLGITKEGLGKEFGKVTNYTDDIKNIDNTKAFSPSIKKLIGDFIGITDENSIEINKLINEGYINFGGLMVKPTTMTGHMLINSVSMADAMWGKLLPYNNGAFRVAINMASEVSKVNLNSRKEKIKFEQLLIKEFKKFLSSAQGIGTINGDPELERTRLFKDITDNPSLASYISLLQKRKPLILKTNKLLSKLKTTINIDKISTLIFDNTTEHGFAEEEFYHAFAELLKDNIPLPDFKSNTLEGKQLPLNLSDENFKNIGNFDKTVLATNKNFNIKKGEMNFIVLPDGQRMKIQYMGEMTVNEYNQNGNDFLTDNNSQKLGKNTQAFVDGEKKHIFKFLPAYTTRQLAQDLISYSMLSGEQQGSIDFVKYIPLEYLENVGYTNFMNGIKPNDARTFGKLMGVNADNISDFLIQFFQHNPKELVSIPSKMVKKLKIKNRNSFDAARIRLLEQFSKGAGSKLFDEFGNNIKMLSIWNNNKLDIYILHYDTYFRIPTLGAHGMSEYDLEKSNVNSILSDIKLNPLKLNPVNSTKNNMSKAMDVNTYSSVPTDPLMLESNDSSKILQNISDIAIDSDIADLANILKNIKSSVTITQENLVGSGQYRTKDGKNPIIAISNHLKGHVEKQGEIFVHEFIHSVTSEELNRYFDNDGNLLDGATIEKLPEHIRQLYNAFNEAKIKLGITSETITKLKEKIKNKLEIDDSIELTKEDKLNYGFFNIKEFMTMTLTNPLFKDEMQNLKIENKSMLDYVTDFISKLINVLTGTDNPNIYDLVKTVLIDSIEKQSQYEAPTIAFIDQSSKIENIKEKNGISKRLVYDRGSVSLQTMINDRWETLQKGKKGTHIYTRIENENPNTDKVIVNRINKDNIDHSFEMDHYDVAKEVTVEKLENDILLKKVYDNAPSKLKMGYKDSNGDLWLQRGVKGSDRGLEKYYQYTKYKGDSPVVNVGRNKVLKLNEKYKRHNLTTKNVYELKYSKDKGSYQIIINESVRQEINTNIENHNNKIQDSITEFQNAEIVKVEKETMQEINAMIEQATNDDKDIATINYLNELYDNMSTKHFNCNM